MNTVKNLPFSSTNFYDNLKTINTEILYLQNLQNTNVRSKMRVQEYRLNASKLKKLYTEQSALEKTIRQAEQLSFRFNS